MGKTASDHHVVNGRRIERRDLFHEGLDAETGQIVGPDIDQRALVGPPDRRAGGVNDHR